MLADTARTRGASVYEPTTPPDTARPLAAAERFAMVDALRGVAILGVLVAYTFWNLGSPPSNTWSRGERILDAVTDALVDGKFVTIFAFLFGIGTAQQWWRIEAAGQSPAGIHVRRMLFLLVAGLLHAMLLRNGDILAPYAILGLLLFVARRWPTRRIVVAIVMLALMPYGFQLALRAASWKLPDRPLSGPTQGWFGYWSDNFQWVRYWYSTNPLLSWPRILAVMLAGVLAERARLMARLATDARLARRILFIALPIALVARAVSIVLPGRWNPQHPTLVRDIALNQLYFIGAWSLAAVYIALFALLCQRPVWPRRLQWLRAVGRMAFTNYLVQAVIVAPLCIALDLFDAVTPERGLMLAIGVTAIEIPFSVWWLNRFQYGPVEWAWRRVTYGSRFAVTRA
jgi:uncharacterized protein